jgi:signal transduction histidine kinase
MGRNTRNIARVLGEGHASRDRQPHRRSTIDAAECDQEDFLALVGHELRHAAGVVYGFLDLLVTRGDQLDEDRRGHALVRAHANARHMNRLLEDVDVALRLGAGRFSFDLRPLELGTVVEHTATQIGELADRRIDVVRPDSVPPALADHDRQVQILTNLLSNALAYSPDGSSVRVTLSAQPAEVTVDVHNEGDSVPVERLEGLFEPFVRLEEAHPGARDGLGLGMYIAKLLVEGQGGTICADSDESGWTLSYTVPRADR